MRKKTGYIQRRGPTTFRISYYDLEHIRQFETIHGTRDDAQRELAIRLGDLAKGIPVSSKPNTVLFEELCADVVNYYEVNGHRSTSDIDCRYRLHILPRFGKRKASSITTAQLNTYVLLRREEGASTGTIKRELEAIRRAFLLAVRGRKFSNPPHLPMLREHNVRAGFFTKAEVDRLCAVLRHPYDSFVRFAFLTGWRYSEIQGLKWSNVDFVAGEVRLEPGTTKNMEGRVFPMSNELRELLVRVRAGSKGPRASATDSVPVKSPLVITGMTSVFAVKGRPIGAFRKTWKRACHKAGLPCVVTAEGKLVKSLRIFHDLRRSAVREMVRQGLSQPAIMKLVGHKTDSMFRRYAIVSEADLREAVRLLNGAENGAKSDILKS